MFGATLPTKPPIRAPNPSGVNPWAPPPGYTPTLPDGVSTATPESKTGLYVGLGLAALIVGGGIYFIFVRH